MIYAVALLLYSTCYVWYSIIGMGHPLTLLSRMIESIFWYHTYLPGLGETFETSTLESYYHRDLVCIRNTDFCNGFFYRAKHWLLDDMTVIALGLPCFFMVYGKREKYEMLFDAVCKAAVICSIAYFFVCLAGEFWNDNTWVSGRYNGLTIDANKIGSFALLHFVVLCTIFWSELLDLPSTQYHCIGNGFRTNLFNSIKNDYFGDDFHCRLFLYHFNKKCIFCKNTKKLLRSTVTIILALLLALVCVKGVYALQGVHQEKLQEVLSSEIATEEPVSTENVSENVNDNAPKDEYREMLPKEGDDANAFSSGRIHIWQTYAKGFNFIGNSADAATPISPEIYQRTAHNSSVEITYRSGYITGGVYLILVLITGIYLVLIMLRNNEKNSNGDYFIAITAIGYIIFTNLMSSFNPLTASIFLLYVIAFPALLNSSWKTIKASKYINIIKKSL